MNIFLSLQLDGPLWISITDNAKDLVRKMLSVDPNKRITIHEVINHKWLKVSIVQAFQHSCTSSNI